MNKRQSQVIIRPLITEKSTILMEKGQYSFEVLKSANKVEIAQALEQLLKELYPKHGFQILQPLTHCRGGTVKILRRTRYTGPSSDGEKYRDMIKIEFVKFHFI